MKFLRRFWSGSVRIQMTGEYPERFFNLCASSGLDIWDVIFSKGNYIFSMGIRDFFSSRPYAKKAKIRLRIQRKLGLPFFLYKNRKRKLWAAGFLCFFLLLYTLSFFVWDIGYQGNVMYTDDELSHFLDTMGIRCGIMKNQVSCEDLEAALRNEYNGITWVSARLSGTKLYVHVKENDVPLEIPVRDNTPCDLTADADGTITSMIVRSGIPMVKPGDEVVKGQILVSGAIPITDDGGTVVAEHYVHSDADIIARRTRQETKDISLWHEREEKTGRIRKGLMTNIGAHSFVYLIPNFRNTEWRTVTEIRQVRLFGDFYLPMELGLITSQEVCSYDEKYTEKELEELGEAYKNEVAEKLMEKGVQIIENNVKILVNGSSCRFEVNMQTEEPFKTETNVETQGEQPDDEHN